jgi:hypothetical protein
MVARFARVAGASVMVLLGLAACEQQSSPVAALSETGPSLASSSGAVLVECPSNVTTSAEGTIGSLGGSVELANHRLALPALAVLEPTVFTLTDPAGKYMLLDLKGNGQESFGFEKPATVTIDYSRCTRSNIDQAELSVWKVDPETKALLKNMGGIDDKAARTITFTTDSLSMYSLAN